MIFSMALEVFGQLRDPAGEERNLHVRAAGVLLIDLEGLGVGSSYLAHLGFDTRQPGGEVHFWYVEP